MKPWMRIARAVGPRAGIFLGALFVRVLVGAVFFGCVDMLNELNASADFFAGRTVPLPYLPGVQYLIWIGAIIAAKTSLPLTLGYKLLPIVFDSLLAVIVYDAARDRGKGALTCGALYALCPVAIVVSSVHAQWDPIFLAIFLVALRLQQLPALGWRFIAGFLFFASGVVKPVPFALLPFFLSAPSASITSVTYVRRELGTVVGAAVCAALYVVAAARAGYPVFDAIPLVANYVSEGYPLFGLPFAGVHLFQNRVWILPVIGLVGLLYLRGKVDPYEAILVVFASIIGTCGLAPQYLVWVIPFAIITRRFVFLGIYTVVATTFQLMFFASPLSSNRPYENLAAFAPLKEYAWLIPTVLRSEEAVRRMKLLGNVAIPVVTLGFVAVFLVGMIRGRTDRLRTRATGARSWRIALGYVCALACIVIGVKRVAAWRPPSAAVFASIVATKSGAYEVEKRERFYVLPRSYENVIAAPANAVSIGESSAVLFALAALALGVRGARARCRAARASTPGDRRGRDGLPAESS